MSNYTQGFSSGKTYQEKLQRFLLCFLINFPGKVRHAPNRDVLDVE